MQIALISSSKPSNSTPMTETLKDSYTPAHFQTKYKSTKGERDPWLVLTAIFLFSTFFLSQVPIRNNSVLLATWDLVPVRLLGGQQLIINCIRQTTGSLSHMHHCQHITIGIMDFNISSHQMAFLH